MCELGFHGPRPARQRPIIKRANEGLATVDLNGESIPSPSSDRAIVTVAAGDHWDQCRQITRGRMESYAQKCNADLVELSGDYVPTWPMGNKFRVHRVSQFYDRCLYLDTDIVIRSDAPDLFDEVPHDSVAVFDELMATAGDGSRNWARHQSASVAVSQGMRPPRSLPYSANGGVFLLPSGSRDVYAPPARPIPTHWCADQQLLTLRMLERNIEPHLLSWQFNCLLNAPWFEERKGEAFFLHANGAKAESRINLLREWDDATQ